MMVMENLSIMNTQVFLMVIIRLLTDSRLFVQNLLGHLMGFLVMLRALLLKILD